MRLDPFYLPLVPARLGLAYYMLKRYADAPPFLQKCISCAPAFSFGDAGPLQQVIVAVGFRAVEIRVNRETIRHDSIAEYVPGYISATRIAAAVAGLDKEAQTKIVTDVRDALPPYRIGDGLAAPIEAYVVLTHR